MADKGFIPLPREIVNLPIWNNPNKVKLLILCMTKASYKRREYTIGNQTITLEPGQFITGRRAIEEEFNQNMPCSSMSKGLTLFRYLEQFESLGILNIKKTNKYSVVTVLFGSEYIQDCTSDEQQMNNKRTTDEQQMNTNNKDNNINKEKNIKTYAHQDALASEKDLINEFEKLWELYPNKKSKSKAMRSYISARKRKKDPVTYEQVKTGIEAYNKYIQAKGLDMQYIKHGSTWFHQECWNDDYTIAKNPKVQDNIQSNNGWY
ncbi:MAG: hypothetical protein HFF01_02635 [Erysipelotrichaceae bacterium]|nr:hypothetical protein [Erysipelotrichaceae bacterium]MCI9312523.1 hypothetical protein [Erysipelotrichaceae bacterium]MCI9523935.1 hypothetical protein [Erysipelotrichaceae bacterium]